MSIQATVKRENNKDGSINDKVQSKRVRSNS